MTDQPQTAEGAEVLANRMVARAEQPRTSAGRELLRYLGHDMDADYIRRTIIRIENEPSEAVTGKEPAWEDVEP